MEENVYDKVTSDMERHVQALHDRAYKIVEEHWQYVRGMERRLPGWENKSRLQVRCSKLKGNSFRADWTEIKWFGSKANGDRRSVRIHIAKPKGAHLYTLSKLKTLARDWEAQKVEETEMRLSDIRREASHLVKAIINIRNARSAATHSDAQQE